MGSAGLVDSVHNGSWRCKPCDKNGEQSSEHRDPSAAETRELSATGPSAVVDEGVVEGGALQIARVERILTSHGVSIGRRSAMGVARSGRDLLAIRVRCDLMGVKESFR